MRIDSDFDSYLINLDEQIESVIESNSAQVPFSFEPSEQIDMLGDQAVDEINDSGTEKPYAVMSQLFRHPDFIQSDFADDKFAENQAIVVKHDKAISLIIDRIEKNRCSNSKTSPARYTICILIVAIGLFLIQHYWVNSNNVSPLNIPSIHLLVEKSLSSRGPNHERVVIETVSDKYGMEYSVNYETKKIKLSNGMSAKPHDEDNKLGKNTLFFVPAKDLITRLETIDMSSTAIGDVKK